jgi:hypothetical protein
MPVWARQTLQEAERHTADGSVKKYKMILVVRGFSQAEGVNYDETC